MKPQIISFVDTETTGLDSEEDEIIQIAVVKAVHPAGSSDLHFIENGTMEIKVLPTQKVPAEVAKLNGYNDEVWAKEGVPLDKAMLRFLKFIEWTNFAGQNPAFDQAFLKASAKRCKLPWPRMQGYRLIAVEMLAWPLLLAGKIPNVKQETLVKYLGLGEQTHDALDDVRQCAQIYSRLIGPVARGVAEFDPLKG
jgi:DNA polymerase-3 subunit epsilon/ATP-dependent DNA helicase DinG